MKTVLRRKDKKLEDTLLSSKQMPQVSPKSSGLRQSQVSMVNKKTCNSIVKARRRGRCVKNQGLIHTVSLGIVETQTSKCVLLMYLFCE